MKKMGIIMVAFLLFTMTSCVNLSTTDEEEFDAFNYNSLSFPNYSLENPTRYLDEDEQGYPINGWQDFGETGEIMTHPWPMFTYTYQMYSYYIRNDLKLLYTEIELPETLGELPEWITKTTQNGHRIIWYSMGFVLPDEITLNRSETLTSVNGIQTFLKAEYTVLLGETEDEWVIYFMEENGIYCSYAVRANESYEQVVSTADFIVETYQKKSSGN
jgi:hypothetical protein